MTCMRELNFGGKGVVLIHEVGRVGRVRRGSGMVEQPLRGSHRRSISETFVGLSPLSFRKKVPERHQASPTAVFFPTKKMFSAVRRCLSIHTLDRLASPEKKWKIGC